MRRARVSELYDAFQCKVERYKRMINDEAGISYLNDTQLKLHSSVDKLPPLMRPDVDR